MERLMNIYLKAEKVKDDEYILYATNLKYEKIMMSYNFVIYNDHKGRVVERGVSGCYELNNVDNYTIYYNDIHVMDFSHSRLWKV